MVFKYLKYILSFRNKTSLPGVIPMKGVESMLIFISMAEPVTGDDNAMLEACIAKLAEGDVSAMEPIYDATRASVYAYALSMLKSSFDAEDVMHDCYMKIFSSAKGYAPRGKPLAYIMTVTRNLCLDRLKESGRTANIPDEDWEKLLRVEDVPSNLEAAGWMKILNDEERQIVLLHAVGGFKHRETAQIMEMPLATVLSRYSRALKKLKKHIAEREGEI